MSVYRKGRAEQSGKCGEQFCKEHFGIVEDETYEIKSAAWRNYQFVVRCVQMMRFHEKFFVVVRYKRKQRTLKRGPRKGQQVADESIASAYKKHLDVYVIRGIEILKILAANGQRLRATKFENDAHWAPYWVVLIKWLPTDVLYTDERCTVYGIKDDPPPWLNGRVPF